VSILATNARTEEKGPMPEEHSNMHAVRRTKRGSRLENENEQSNHEPSTKVGGRSSYREEMPAAQLEIRTLTRQLQALTATTTAERDELNKELRAARSEIEALKNSLPFRTMRLYKPIIEHLMPDGTRRGKFKRGVMRRLGVIYAPTREANVDASKQEPVTREEELRIKIHCDTPRLTELSAVKVSEWLVVEGWALSSHGIKNVKMSLDDKSLGPVFYGVERFDVALGYPNIHGSVFSGFRKMLKLRAGMAKGPHRLKITAESNDGDLATIEGLIQPIRSVPIKTTVYHRTEPRSGDRASVSVVIPTKVPPSDFEQTLQRIISQDTSNPEVIILNSGAEDLGRLEAEYHARVLKVNPKTFNHGRVRNYGARIAGGEYVIFMSDDALPANRHLFSDMVKMIGGRNVAAVSARQIPRTDADLMASFSICAHYQMLRLDRDRVTPSARLDELTPDEKRRLCQIDDVCSCYRRSLFLRHKYSEHLQYAEDLDLGIRLVKRKFRLGQLFTNGVIHSHNRKADYYLRRTYVDVKVLSKLLEDTTSGQLMIEAARSLDKLVGYCVHIQNSVSAGVKELRELNFCGANTSLAFETLRKALQKSPEKALLGGDDYLRKVLNQIIKITGCKRPTDTERNPLVQSYLALLSNFEHWLSTTHQSLEGIEDQFAETLYKLLGFEIGTSLGQFCERPPVAEREVAAKLDAFLSAGI
jgi:rhamnosyltransferase